jgi:hypothetical protein
MSRKKPPVTSRLKNIDVGETIEFPVYRYMVVNTIIQRLKEGYGFTITKDGKKTKVTRTR